MPVNLKNLSSRINLTTDAPSKRCRRESPMFLKAAILLQQTLIEHEPETPWHLHTNSISDLIAWKTIIITSITQEVYKFINYAVQPLALALFVHLSTLPSNPPINYERMITIWDLLSCLPHYYVGSWGHQPCSWPHGHPRTPYWSTLQTAGLLNSLPTPTWKKIWMNELGACLIWSFSLTTWEKG